MATSTPPEERVTLADLVCKSDRTLEGLVGMSEAEIDALNHRDFANHVLDKLSFTNRMDLMFLLPLARRPRRFHAFGVGLLKTGTTSLTGMCTANYRARHEYLVNDTTQVLKSRKAGGISDERFRDFIRYRSLLGHIEMDSAFYNHFYMDVARELWPDVKFVLTIRDCYSWLDSLLNSFANRDNRKVSGNISELLFGFRDFEEMDFDALRTNVGRYAETLLEFWATAHRCVVQDLQPDDLFVVRTHEISDSTARIAEFLGVPADTVLVERSRLNVSNRKHNLLREVDRDLLESLTQKHCSKLMEGFFPSYTLDDFLNKRPIPPRA